MRVAVPLSALLDHAGVIVDAEDDFLRRRVAAI
jgi:hypothetical protein